MGQSKCACGGCACGKSTSKKKLDGRIIQRTTPCHGQMAPTSRRNFLVCFYCNKKSGIRYDGLITQWECARCDSTNFLDENGEITDPPVATDHASPSDLKYSFTRADSPLSETSSQGTASSPFCSTCLKNQHLYISSLQQFHVEIDPSHPEYKESEREYYIYKKNLEKLYPQVCEDCLPNYNKGLEDARKTLKSDVIRRSLGKSKLRVRHAVKGITFAGARDFMGSSLWYIGLLCQLLWHLVALVALADHHIKTALDSSYPSFIPDSLSALSEASSYLPKGSSLGRWGLRCCVASLWWSPRFNNLNVGFTTHITGYKYWYKHQLIFLVVRGLFYYVMANEVFENSFHSAIGAAHLFTLVFVTFLAIRAHSFIKVDMTRLWSNAPPRLPHIGPGSSPKQSGDSLRDALNELGTNPSRLNRPTSTPSPPSYDPSYRRYKPEPYQSGSIRVGHDRTGSTLPFKTLNIQSRRESTSPPLFNNTYNPSTATSTSSQPNLDRQYAGMNLGGMDWSPEPSQPKSQHRAFTENLPVDRDAVFFGRAPPQQNTKLFGQSPVVPQPGPFWYKVPPAPIAPAHNLRNPPNQPRIRTVSQEQKRNFFDVSQGSKTTRAASETTTNGNHSAQRPEIEFAQQKFFAPEVRSEGHDVLVSALSGWSLGDSDRHPGEVVAKSGARYRHIAQGITLFIALFFWNQALNNPSEHPKYIVLAIMFGCLCIGARTILDNTIYTAEDTQIVEHALAYTLGACLGGLECSAALYGLAQILGGSECETCGPLGTVLIGGMLVHQMWVASFG